MKQYRHVHIPKTGGTTINAALKTHFGPEHCWGCAQSNLYRERWEAFEEKEKKMFFVGHSYLWTGNHELDSMVRFTFLRHPIARGLSHLHHRIYDLRSLGREEEFEDKDAFIEAHPNLIFNTQCRILVGESSLDVPVDIKELADAAWWNLTQHTHWGLMEYFQASWRDVMQSCGIDLKIDPKFSKNVRKDFSWIPTKRQIQRISEFCPADLLLYERAHKYWLNQH